MPMGTTHRRLNTAISVPMAAGALWLKWDSGFIVSLLAGFHFATYFMNPDLDLNSLGYKSWGWLRFMGTPIGPLRNRRDREDTPRRAAVLPCCRASSRTTHQRHTRRSALVLQMRRCLTGLLAMPATAPVY